MSINQGVARLSTLMIHTLSHEPEDLILNQEIFHDFSIGDVIQIFDPERPGEKLILKISALQAVSGRLEISLSKVIADQFNFKPFSKVVIEKIDLKSVSIDFVELSFKKQYFQRGNMWRFKREMIDRSLYINQNITINNMQAQIQDLRKESNKVLSGLVTEETKFVFRSRSSRIIWLVQISAEMWDVDQNGELYFEKFLSEFVSPLLDNWRSLGVTHLLSVIFFSRTFYFDRISKASHPDLCAKKSLLQTHDGIYYQDFFKIVIENLADIDKNEHIDRLRKEFWAFPKNMNWNIPNFALNPTQVSHSMSRQPLNYSDPESLESVENNTTKQGFEDTNSGNKNFAVPSDAVNGNFLEAINTTLNILSKHYMDRDLQRTGNSIVMISAGSGVFRVKPNLSQITKQRMLDNAFGLDFISLSRPSTHVVPLFLVDCRAEGVKDFYETPHWMRVSYIDCKREIEESLEPKYSSNNPVNENQNESDDSKWVRGFMPPPNSYQLSSQLMNCGDLSTLSSIYSQTLPSSLKTLIIENHNIRNDLSTSNDNILSKKFDSSKQNDISFWGAIDTFKMLTDSKNMQNRFFSNSIFYKQEVENFSFSSMNNPSVAATNRLYNIINGLPHIKKSKGDNIAGSFESIADTDIDSISEEKKEKGGNYASSYEDSEMGSYTENFLIVKKFNNGQTDNGTNLPNELSRNFSSKSLNSTDSNAQNSLTDIRDQRDALGQIMSGDYADRADLIELMSRHDKQIFKIKNKPILSSRISFESNKNSPSSLRDAIEQKGSNPTFSEAEKKTTLENKVKIEEKSTKQIRGHLDRHSSRLYPQIYSHNLNLKNEARGLSTNNKAPPSHSLLTEKLSKSNEITNFQPVKQNVENHKSASAKYKLSSKSFLSKSQVVANNYSAPSIQKYRSNISNKGNLEWLIIHGKVTSLKKEDREENKIDYIKEYSRLYCTNPFKLKDSEKYINSITHNRRRWSHVFPHGKNIKSVDYGLNWKSLTQPAILPLNTDFLPDIKMLHRGYDVNNQYTLLVDTMDSNFLTSEDLLNELVCQRLGHEFQIFEGHSIMPYFKFITHNSSGKISNKYSSSESGKKNHFFILTMGHRIQFLYYDSEEDQVWITQYVSKRGQNLNDEKNSYTYNYETWVPHTNMYQTITQTFYQFPNPEYLWNKADNIIINSSDFDSRNDDIKPKRLKYIIVPERVNNAKDLDDYYSKIDLLIEFFGKYCEDSSPGISIYKDKSYFDQTKIPELSASSHIEDKLVEDGPDDNKVTINLVNKSVYVYTQTSKEFDIVKMIMRGPRHKNPNWLFLRYDKNIYSYKAFHFEIHWLVCDSWLIDDFITVLFRRCGKWGLRLCQNPDYFSSFILNVHPYRAFPYIQVARKRREINKAFPSPLRLIERLYFTRSNGWIFDNEYKTEWSALGLNNPKYLDRDRDLSKSYEYFKISVSSSISGQASESILESKILNLLPSFSKSIANLVNSKFDNTKDNNDSSSNQTGTQLHQLSINKTLDRLDRQYTFVLGLASIRLAGQGFLWMQNATAKVSDINLSTEEKKEISFNKYKELESFCDNVSEIYDIVLELIEDFLSITDFRDIIKVCIDNSIDISESKTHNIDPSSEKE